MSEADGTDVQVPALALVLTHPAFERPAVANPHAKRGTRKPGCVSLEAERERRIALPARRRKAMHQAVSTLWMVTWSKDVPAEDLPALADALRDLLLSEDSSPAQHAARLRALKLLRCSAEDSGHGSR